jgi:hypothetical protein
MECGLRDALAICEELHIPPALTGRKGVSKYFFLLRWWSLPLATVWGLVTTVITQTPALGVEAAWLGGFTQPDGVSVFALTLKASVPVAAGPRDVVFLISTAARQTGEFRVKSLATLQSTLSQLAPNDRVKLIAFDLNAVSLTAGFVAPNGQEMTSALGALNQRTPLGSGDLEKALDTAAKSYAGENKLARAIVLIGDGSSRANPLTLEQIDRVVNDLLAQRAPVIAFAIGPQIQEQLLGTLASRTGGMVVPEQANVDAGAYGTILAQAVHGTVLWPKAAGSVKWPEGMIVYPKVFPPLRNDRDTVLVGSEKSTSAKQVEVDVDGPSGAQKLVWEIPALKSNPANGYLVTLVEQAKVDDGRTLPLIDSASLAMAKLEIEAGGRGLAQLAREALSSGNLESADRLASAALARNPNDPAARAVKDAIARTTVGPLVRTAGYGSRAGAGEQNAPARSAPGDLNLQGDNAGVPPPNGTAAAQDISQSNALEEQWQKDVQNTINKARSQVMVDPSVAEAMIQNKINDLSVVAEMRPEMRERLMGMLRAASREIKRRKDEVVFRDQQRIREEVARREMEMTNAELQQAEKKVDQLMSRYNSLMNEAQQRLSETSADKAMSDAQVAVIEATKIVDGSMPSAKPTMVAGLQHARFVSAYDDIMAVRVAKQKGFIDAMYQTERSHIPTPDDPPIVYPDPEVWKELTARRKERYSSVSLSKPSPAEKKIEEELKKPTQIEFVETPLKDVVDYLKDLHKIEIQLDSAALKEAGVDDSTPVTKNLKGISLRSALKLLLDELQLKYVIHNEVLLITSPSKAESDDYMSTKVYPVADLVLPIQQTGFTGGFGGMGGMSGGIGGMGMGGMGGGMMGGMGGGMGGMGMGGMGMGGMGMGGMGMGGMGMGGGMFDIPPENVPHAH